MCYMNQLIHFKFGYCDTSHWLKSLIIQNFSSPYFPAFRQNADHENFSRSEQNVNRFCSGVFIVT